ncbi:MAG: oxidoreductase [Phycisphaerae bacterium]|nr:MAG: oxidoreductase [Phycisphaerae bacterium]
MPTFEATSIQPAAPAEAFAWHERPGAFDRLIPPWMRAEVLERSGGLRPGGRLLFVVRRGAGRVLWDARHTEYDPGLCFVDEMARGPFRTWRHEHRFEPGPSAGTCTLCDTVTLTLPGGRAAWMAAGRWVRADLERLFAYRHARLRADLEALAEFDAARGSNMPWRVAVSGSHGLIGSALTSLLMTGGHAVTRLVRTRVEPGDVLWQAGHGGPGGEGQIDRAGLEGVDAIVHLAGAPLFGGRWTKARRQEFRDSRVEGTRLIAHTAANLAQRPRVMIVASGIGLYGDRGDQELAEDAGVGSGFFAELARDWEAAAEPARQAGVRVVHLRLGIVLGARGGVLASVRRPFALGLGMIPGSGAQWTPWVSLEDTVRAVLYACARETLEGAVNVASPGVVRADEFVNGLARSLGRPLAGRAPGWMVRALAGERSEALLASTRAAPARLLRDGFRFAHASLEDALRWEWGMEARNRPRFAWS